MQPPGQHALEPAPTAAAAAGLPTAPAAAPGLQTVPELSRLQQQGREQPEEDVFARNTPEELMLEGHRDADASHQPPCSSSLTEALASEAVSGTSSAAPAEQVMAPKVSVSPVMLGLAGR